MKKILSIVTGFIALSGTASAQNVKADSMNVQESQKIAEALETLKDSGVLIKYQNGCFDIDKDVLEKLKLEGYIKNKRSHIQTICNGNSL